jgi:hypothetical protein
MGKVQPCMSKASKAGIQDKPNTVYFSLVRGLSNAS